MYTGQKAPIYCESWNGDAMIRYGPEQYRSCRTIIQLTESISALHAGPQNAIPAETATEIKI